MLLGPWLLAQSAAVRYVIDTEAGYVPPDSSLALAQYLDSPAAVAYDARNTLYFVTLNRIWRLGTSTVCCIPVEPNRTLSACHRSVESSLIRFSSWSAVLRLSL